jgi:uncharacterized membrane protein
MKRESTKLEKRIDAWTQAGVIDASTADRIRAFEANQENRESLRWPVILALAFGGILLAAGITLFVAAHWEEMSPAMRFSVVLLMVFIFHAAGAAAAEKFPALATTLHGIGTAVLGAGIYLTAQIFNLHENWPTGVLLWAIGAAIGYIAFRDWVHAAALALLVPAWLISEWSLFTENHAHSDRPLAVGLLLTSLCYLSVRAFDQESVVRKTLVWVGAIALLPCAGIAIGIAESGEFAYAYSHLPVASKSMLTVGWAVSLLAPLALAWLMRGKAAWHLLAWAAWAFALVTAAGHMESWRNQTYGRSLAATAVLYVLCALGSVALIAWGLTEKRKERVNLGVAAFAISVLFFYFDSFMGKLDRSVSLVLLGGLCLAGGYALELTRRKLTARMESAS